MTTKTISKEEILQALGNDEFVYFYQPKVSLITGKVIGAEALLRWIKPNGDILPPSAFIPVAESENIIGQMTLTLFPKLARDLLIFSDIDSALVISMNATAADFAQDDFTRQVLTTLKQTRIPTSQLQIEITETTAIQADSGVRKRIQTLCEAGIGLAMDDYGTGYSTLETLSQWPFTTIKLDRSIIERMLVSEKNRTIAESSIRMAHELNLAIVAEGVESDIQYQTLLESGCTKVQGYWISAPLSLDDFIFFLQQDLRWSGLPVGLIHMAAVDHIQWRKKLISEVVRSASSSHTADITEAALNLPPLEHTKCRLGNWYYGVGQQFRGCELFDAIEEPHRIFHELGCQLIAVIGKGENLHQLTPVLTKFSEHSSMILDLLHKLEHKGLMEMHQAHHAWEQHQLRTRHV